MCGCEQVIPEFDENGNLAPGVHFCEWNEFKQRFGTNITRQRLNSANPDLLEINDKPFSNRHSKAESEILLPKVKNLHNFGGNIHTPTILPALVKPSLQLLTSIMVGGHQYLTQPDFVTPKG